MRAGGASGGGGAAMAGVLQGVLQGDVFIAELVVGRRGACEVDGGDWWRVGGCDCGLVGRGAVEGVLEDACGDGGQLWCFGQEGGVMTGSFYLWGAWRKGLEENESG